MELDKIWIRVCNKCNKDIIHKDKYSYIKGIKFNKLCSFCSRQKTGKNNKDSKRTKEFKNNLSLKMKNHPKIKGNKERGEKIRKKLLNRNTSHWPSKKKSIIKQCIQCDGNMEVQPYRIHNKHFCNSKCKEEYYHLNGIWQPRFNPKACKIIDEYGIKNGYNFKHALNGGEYYIKELKFFVDGYDLEKNVVIEFYEKHHTSYIKRDLERQNKIINLLKCKFIILYYNNKIEIYE